MSGLHTAISQLETEWKALALGWEETQKVWTDLVRRDFEEEYRDALTARPPAVQREMERLAQVIAGARRVLKWEARWEGALWRFSAVTSFWCRFRSVTSAKQS